MTDKEIIIDGVDVSKCIHIDYWEHCNCCNDFIKTIYPKATKCPIEEDLRCETYPNCYFKQLKRKEQKCEKYKQALDEIEELVIHNNLLVRDPFCGSGYRDLSGEILNIINKARNK